MNHSDMDHSNMDHSHDHHDHMDHSSMNHTQMDHSAVSSGGHHGGAHDGMMVGDLHSHIYSVVTKYVKCVNTLLHTLETTGNISISK